MIDRLRQMAIFSKTIDHGSFRGAARELRVSPSVVSHHISQLEEHLGVALIYRTTRKLSLTLEGERLLAATHKMLEAVEGELLDLSSSAADPSGELRLTAPSVLSQSGFTDQFAGFSTLYPKVRLTVDFSDLRRDLIADGFDMAIRMSATRLRNSATTRNLFTARRTLVASTVYLSGRKAVDQPKDVTDWDWVSLSPSQDNTFRNGRETQTINPKAKLHTNDAQALYRLARAGAGLALVPDYLATHDIAEGRVRCVLPDWEPTPVNVFASWPANAPKKGLTRLMLNHLKETSPT